MNATQIRFFLVNLLIFINLLSVAQMNLDFELQNTKNTKPIDWDLKGENYFISLDSTIKYSGRFSLKLESVLNDKNDFGAFITQFPLSETKISKIKLSGKIKSSSVINGYAGLWIRVDGENGVLNFDNMPTIGLKGTNYWIEKEIELTVDSSATAIYLGGILTGSGIAWFDDLKIFINGIEFINHKPLALDTTSLELLWLKKYVYPIYSFDFNYKDFKDLDSFYHRISDATVIGIGESTHGSSETMKIRHRFFKYLELSNKELIFSPEANFPESYKINDYINKDIGDANEAISGMNYWIWNTKEMLDMVNWMKEQNSKKSKIQYIGFDMVYYEESLKELENSFKGDLKTITLIQNIRKMFLDFEQARNTRQSINEIYQDKNKVINTLDTIRKNIEGNFHLDENSKFLLYNCRILEQYYFDSTFSARDRFMAENLLWVKSQNPSSKIIIGAHNEHIKKAGIGMGKFISERLKNNYVSIALSFYKGKARSLDEFGIECRNAEEAYLGTYEYLFNFLESPIFILDLQKINEDKSRFSLWFKTMLKLRKVGGKKEENEFEYSDISSEFDFIIFIKESSCSSPLKY